MKNLQLYDYFQNLEPTHVMYLNLEFQEAKRWEERLEPTHVMYLNVLVL